MPDVRDGLTPLDRAILLELRRAQAERGGASVPTAMLYGRVVEKVNVSQAQFLAALRRLLARG